MSCVRDLLPRLPAEVFAVGVVVPVALVVGDGGDLEGAFFLVVIMVLYSAWHLGSHDAGRGDPGRRPPPPRGSSPTSSSPRPTSGGRRGPRPALFTFVLGRASAASRRSSTSSRRPGRRWPSRRWPRSGGASPASCTTWPATRWPPCSSTSPAPATCCAATSTRPSGRCVDAETVGRSSLDQIRATVAALRTDERGTDPALAGVGRPRRAGRRVPPGRAGDRRRTSRPAPAAIDGPGRARPCTASPGRRWPTSPGTPPATGSSSRSTPSTGEVHLVVADHGRPAAPRRPDAGPLRAGRHARAGPGARAASSRPGRRRRVAGRRPPARLPGPPHDDAVPT